MRCMADPTLIINSQSCSQTSVIKKKERKKRKSIPSLSLLAVPPCMMALRCMLCRHESISRHSMHQKQSFGLLKQLASAASPEAVELEWHWTWGCHCHMQTWWRDQSGHDSLLDNCLGLWPRTSGLIDRHWSTSRNCQPLALMRKLWGSCTFHWSSRVHGHET